MKQTLKVLTTLNTPLDDHLKTLFVNLVEKLVNKGWSVNLDISENGTCWQITGNKGMSLPEMIDIEESKAYHYPRSSVDE